MADKANLVLRVKTRSGRLIVNGLNKNSTLKELQKRIQDQSSVAISCQKILIGYPPKGLSLRNSGASLTELGIKSGDSLIVEELSPQAVSETRHLSPPYKKESPPHKKEAPIPKISRRIVPSDNSCLFRSISILLTNGSVTVQELRELVAGIILSDPDKFSTVMLGRSNEDYAEWIMKGQSWGGAIELSILSDSYQTELHVVDIQTNRIDKFGQNRQYSTKALLIYDGIHYDPLVCHTGNSEVTIFTVDNEQVATLALNMAQEAQQARQFTDTANFTLRCLACGQRLVGQKDAQAHAEQTQHTSFGEI